MTRDDALTGCSESFLYARAHGESYRRTGHSVMTRHLGFPDQSWHRSKPAWPKKALEILKNFSERLRRACPPGGLPRIESKPARPSHRAGELGWR
jgi:hypothetical protein